MSVFWGNIFLPVVWMALTGKFTLANYFLGFLISSFALWIARPPGEVAFLVYLERLRRWLDFFFFFLWELVVASAQVTYDILTPHHRMRPAVIAIPLDLQTDTEITLLANMITLTPGTLSLDISPQRDILYIHAMYVDDIEEFRHMIKERFEKRVKEVMR
ncbi:MAG: Na+/H+ antiporter subunit E [Desulfuromonadales bacterium]|nr:Na+/H+ antiporter subunit E [Desulfuromonadales bacterium]